MTNKYYNDNIISGGAVRDGNGKRIDTTYQTVIDDLDTIRSGAEAGATALQEVPSEYVTETELSNYHDNTKQDAGNYAETDKENTFTKGQTITRDTSGAILKLSSGATDTNFILERTNGTQCVLEAGGSIGLFGTKSNHPIQVRTNYQNRMTFGTDGSVTLPNDVTSTSNSNQLATTKFVKAYHDSTKQDVISNLSTIESNATAGKSASDTISGYGDIVTHNASEFMLATTKYGASLTMSVDPTTYVVTATLKDQDGNTLGTAQTIDLPLESVVVSGSYNSATKKVELTLQSGSKIDFSVADLVSGLQTEITSTNKLSADLIQDGTTNKTVTATEKATWNAKSDFSGSYNDLNDKPTIPSKTSDLTNDSGFTSNTGTITGITMNGASKGTSGVVDLGTVITEHQSLKTINNQSIVGSGNLTVNSSTITFRDWSV